MKRRITAILLSMVMVFSMLPVTAWAEEPKKIEVTERPKSPRSL